MRSRSSSLRVAPAVFVALAALAAACSGGGDGASPGGDATRPPDTTPAAVAPEEALRLFVERRYLQGFIADCEDARRPDDIGKQCARFRRERDGLLAFEIGPTFGEYTVLIILERAGATWTIARLETRDPTLPPLPGIPWPLEVGARVVVAGTGDCLRLRDRPGTLAGEVGCIDDGTGVTVTAGPVEADGFEWWRLEGYDGWVAGTWLRYPEEASEQPDETSDE